MNSDDDVTHKALHFRLISDEIGIYAQRVIYASTFSLCFGDAQAIGLLFLPISPYASAGDDELRKSLDELIN